jgi:uncharacterized delta-60 repeat protein
MTLSVDRQIGWSIAQIFFVKRQRRISLIGYVLFFWLALTLSAVFQIVKAADGDLDPTFGNGGEKIIQVAAQQRDFAKTVAVQTDGKIVVGGELGDFSLDTNRAVLMRLNADGSLDQSFGSGGKIINPGQIHLLALAIQPDGKIITAGATRVSGITLDFAAARYNPDGSLDTSFGNGGYAVNGEGEAQSLFLQPDGKIVLVGFLPIFRDGSDYLLARFNPDGTADQTFGTGGRVTTSFTSGRNSADKALGAALQADGKIIATGFATGISAVLIRYNSNGSVDPGFGLDGSVLTPNFGATASRILVQPDGKIVVGGGGFVLGRYNANGTTDQSFGASGRISGGFGSGNGYLYALARQPDGKLLAAGSVCYTGTGDCVFALSRYTPNGGLDQTLGNGGFVLTNVTPGTLDEAFALSLQPNGKIILAGYAAEPGGSYHDFALARYLSAVATVSRPARFDFDGDSRADISVFRQGVWYLNQSTTGYLQMSFGLNTDLIVPADYDGDGKTDIAVFRPGDGDWYCLNSNSNTYSTYHFGLNGDIAAPADYDGDGRGDYAVFRGGVWYIQRTTAGFMSVQFGLATDKPVPADFDGDGKSDIAVYRGGTWYVQKSTGDYLIAQFGTSGDNPVPADYDGDGKSDIAVWRPGEGNWYITESLNGTIKIVNWGLSGDIPVSADYDGDGKTDIAVNRSGGEWWILQSNSNTYIFNQFGISNDIPVPSAFVR